MSEAPSVASNAIAREDGPDRGRYVIRLPDNLEAEMTYRRIDAQTIAIDHTFVPRAFRLAGLALKLMERGIADARAESQKIVPECSYAVVQFERHPEWADLLA